MADTVTGRSHLLPEIMESAHIGDERAQPTALFEKLAAINDPLQALVSPDRANALFESFYSEYGFLYAHAAANPLEPQHRSRWVALFRWFLRELREWRAANDPEDRVLVAIFIVAQANDWDNAFWEHVPQDIGYNTDLLHRLKTMLASFSSRPAPRAGMAAPIWEAEAVEALHLADRESDWVGIGNGVRLFRRQLVPNSAATQPARCLYQCGVSHIVDAVAEVHETLTALQLASALRIDQRLGVAVASSNPYIEFACVYQTVSVRGSTQPLSPSDEQSLKTILLKITADEPRWRAWMQLFNAHPMHYPALQGPLGAALAEAPEAAIDAYVNAIVLNVRPIKPPVPNPNRQCITTCLTRFRANASPDQRVMLWRKAHERWSTWDFDQANPHTFLINVSRSDLDYAIVCFVIECKNDHERREIYKNIISELNALETHWFGSSMDAVLRLYRILSMYQPYAHATFALTNDEDRLTDTKVYFPFAPSENEYVMLKYRIDVDS